jgi:hypothetical protein
MVAEKIQSNWLEFIGYIQDHIQSPRKEKLLEFYGKYEERIAMMPASHKKEYHNAFVGGYVDHVNRVIRCALALHKTWADMGADITTYTKEELVFAALNHDLGKMGDEQHEAYLPNTDQWRKEKLGEEWMFNKALPFASVPDRSLFMLQSHGISYSFNEMVAIQTHDGLYDEANKKYLMGYLPEQKPRTSLPFIIHQADLMAARIEFEQEWLPKFQNPVIQGKGSNTLGSNNQKPTPKPAQAKQKALSSVKSEGLRNMLDNL